MSKAKKEFVVLLAT